MVYFDDILVYSPILEAHLHHLKEVLGTLRKKKLYANTTCSFMADSLTFLGYIVSFEGLQTDPSKVQTIQNWTVPRNITEMQSFHDLASFYRKFIRSFSSIMSPMIDCMKGRHFQWTPKAQTAFEEIKRKIASAVLFLPYFFQDLRDGVWRIFYRRWWSS